MEDEEEDQRRHGDKLEEGDDERRPHFPVNADGGAAIAAQYTA